VGAASGADVTAIGVTEIGLGVGFTAALVGAIVGTGATAVGEQAANSNSILQLKTTIFLNMVLSPCRCRVAATVFCVIHAFTWFNRNSPNAGRVRLD
jgi:phosphate/sulfate permease